VARRSDIQRRGGPQVLALFKRFGITVLPPGMELEQAVAPVAAVPRLDLLCSGIGTIAASVNDSSQVQLFNPVGSGVTVTLHRVWLSVTTAGEVRMQLHDTALGSAITTLQVMRRALGSQQSPSAQMRSTQGNLVGTNAMRFDLDIADRSYQFDMGILGDNQEFVGPSLAEGRGLIFAPTTDNVGNLTNLLWSERITE